MGDAVVEFADHVAMRRKALEDYVQEIHDGYEVWYARSVRRVYRLYSTLQMVALLSGALAAVAAGLMSEAALLQGGRWILIVIPSLGTIAATCLLQFKSHELWALREQGRIEFQELATEGRARLAATSSGDECSTVHNELRQRVAGIEQMQADAFFGLFRPGFVARYAVHDDPARTP